LEDAQGHVHAILSGVRRDLRKAGHSAIRAEAAPGSRWGVLDFGNLIVHVFLRDARDYYALERLWKDAPHHETKAEDYPLAEEPDEMDDFMTAAVADIYVKQGLVKEAQRIYERILKREPGNAERIVFLANEPDRWRDSRDRTMLHATTLSDSS